jgi:hypothetical protein
VAISAATTSAVAGTDVEVNLQIVDSTGAPVEYRQTIYIEAQDSDATAMPDIKIATVSQGDTTTITTSATGAASFTVTDTDPGDAVDIVLFTDGTGSSDDFGAGPDDTVTITFETNPTPTIESLGNTSIPEGTAAQTLQSIVIEDQGTVDLLNATTLKLYLNTTEDIYFTATTPTVTVYDAGGGAGTGVITGAARNVNTRIFDFPITADFAAGDYLVIEGLEVETSSIPAAVTSDKTLSLQLDYDGNGTYDATDPRTITITDTTATTYTYIGTNGVWATASNWLPAGGPPADNDSIIVSPTATTVAPLQLPAAVTSLANVTLQGGSVLDLNGNNLAIVTAFENAGTLRLQGLETVTLTMDTDSGATEYYGTAIYANALPLGTTYQDVLITGSGTWNPGALQTISANGDLTLGDGGDTITFGDGLTVSAVGTLFVNGTIMTTDDAIDLDSAGTVTLSGISSVQTAGGTLSIGAVTGAFTLDLDTTGGTGAGTIAFNGGLGTTNDLTGLSIDSKDAIALPAVDIQLPGAATIIAGGAITQTAAFIAAAGTQDFTASGGAAITLDNAANNFSTVAVSSSGAITVVDADDIVIGSVDDGAVGGAGSLIVTSGGAVTDVNGSSIEVTGTADKT